MFPRFAALSLPLVLATSLLARPPLPEAKGHDLRGPALKKGLVLTVKTTSAAKDMESEFVGPDGAKTVIRTGTRHDREMKYEVLAVAGRALAKQRITYVKGKLASSLEGKEVTDLPLPQVGKVFISEYAKGRWTTRAERPEAKDDPDGLRIEAATICPWTTEDELYPARRVKVGETWEVGAKALQTVFADSAQLTEVTGKMKGKLRAVEKYQGELCAVIDFDLKIKGKVKAGDSEMNVDTTSKIIAYRSLVSGITLKMTGESTMNTTMGEPLKMTIKGKEKTVMLTTVKQP